MAKEILIFYKSDLWLNSKLNLLNAVELTFERWLKWNRPHLFI